VEVIELPRERKRPAGRRFGSLVHAVLATVPLDAEEGRVRQVTELQARVHGAPPEEVRSATRIVTAVLKHPLLDGARQAAKRGECRRETPVTDRVGPVLVEGVVDLAFREGGEWTVIDFKTDQEIESGLEVYRRQVAIYASTIARATGEKARAILVRV